MTELPVQFGPERTLVGVIARPRAAVGDTAVLLFNAGVIPRVGPHRLNVKLARTLAMAGIASLRFDLAGQGDSRAATAQGDYHAQATHDLRAAMDHLEQALGLRRFVLIGICSGAVNAYHTAQVDARVAGVFLFDGYWYRTRWTTPVRHLRRLRSGSWSQLAAAVAQRLARLGRAAPKPPAVANLFAGDESLANPPREAFCKVMQTLVDRGVAIFLVYSGTVIDYYSYAGQFRDAFAGQAFLAKVRCDFLPHIDHTFVTIDMQREIVELVRDWVCSLSASGDPRLAASAPAT